MKLASFRLSGEATWGVVRDDGIAAAPAALRSQYPTLAALFSAGPLDAARRGEIESALSSQPLRRPDALAYDPVIPEPRRILCVGINYLRHIAEMGRERPAYPTLFTRFPDSLVGHGQTVWRPRNSIQYDFEGELAVVIGRSARHVKAKDALGYVAGYAAFLDGSVRDWQRHTSQFVPGKNFPSTGACGPWLTTADEIPDPSSLQLVTKVSGEVMQSAAIADLCFDVPHIIEYCSGFCVLNPGDIIATGTPAGVGFARTPPRWLKAGDVVEVGISGIGSLRNVVADEPFHD